MKKEILEKVLNAHKNVIVEGDVFSGKTTNVLFPIVENAIEQKESLLILDSKEEYINKYYNKLKENNYNTIILNLRDLDKSFGWNPLEYPYNLYKNGDADNAQELLEKIGKVMFYENSAADPFWSLTASDFFAGLSLGLFEDGKEDEINLCSINNMFNGIDKRFLASDYITEYFKLKEPISAPYVFASTTFLAPKETKGSIVSVARQKLRLYVTREKLAYLMSKTTFNIDDVINKPTAIIVVTKDESKALNTIGAMFIEQLYAILVDSKVKIKFNFILDNFDSIEKCNDLTDILSSSVSRNIKVFIATRSISELSINYGNYSIKLCNLLKIEKNDVKVLINNEEETISKDFQTVTFEEQAVELPSLKVEPIRIFDLERFVLEKRPVLPNKNLNLNSKPLENELNVDDLIKSIDDKIEQIEDMKYNRLSFDEIVKNRVNDPFCEELILKYFREELKVVDPVAKFLFKDIKKYDDILNEFTKYLNQRTYDIKDAIEVNGYTAKKISELNPSFTASGVYSFLRLIRDNPKEAENIIKANFPNKDSLPPIFEKNEDLK